MRKYMEVGLACVVVFLLSWNVGCAATPGTSNAVFVPAPTSMDQAEANSKVVDAAGDSLALYKARIKAEFCKP